MILRAILVAAVVAALCAAAVAVSARQNCIDKGGVYVTHSDRPAECVVTKREHKTK